MTRRLPVIVTALLLLAGTAWGAAGIQGRVAWRGELIPGIIVRAYRSIPDIAAGKIVAEAAPAGLDGTYRLELPPGSYYLTARDGSGPLRAGNHFCYYSGAPVQVVAESFRNVGFNLVRVPKEAPPEAAPRSGLRGGQFGPIETGDYFNYYPGNPVTIIAGEVREVKIETITRLSMLEDDPHATFVGVRGQILDAAGKPVARLHVFAYRPAEMTGTPEFFSAPTGADGKFELALPEGGPFYLLARQEFGGPAGERELYGRLGAPVRIDPRGKPQEVNIHVAPKGN